MLTLCREVAKGLQLRYPVLVLESGLKESIGWKCRQTKTGISSQRHFLMVISLTSCSTEELQFPTKILH